MPVSLFAGPWPDAARHDLPPGYITLAEACWSRQSTKRPRAEDVLRQLLHMLEQVQQGQTTHLLAPSDP